MWSALALMACGSGVIKPNISTLMGMTYDQQRPGQLQLRAAAFRWFYFSVNIGSLVSLLFFTQIRQIIIDRTGDQVLASSFSFLMPAVLMIMALTAFALGKKYYAKEVIHHEVKTPEERHQQWMVVKSLLGIFVLIVFFWIAYEQNDNLWVLFIKDNVDGNLNLGFKSFNMPPDGYQWINAGCVLMFIPILNWFFNKVDPTNTRIRPTAKILVGFFTTAATSGVMAFMATLEWSESFCLVDRTRLCRFDLGRSLGLRHRPGTLLCCCSGQHEELYLGVLPSHQRHRQFAQHRDYSGLQQFHHAARR